MTRVRGQERRIERARDVAGTSVDKSQFEFSTMWDEMRLKMWLEVLGGELSRWY